MAETDPAAAPRIVTAAILVIGDEILSGRTKDKNIGYIAEYCTNIGIDIREVRVVPDIEAEIVAAVNALRARYDHVFSTGGIGPTHDDITADSMAAAFGVAIDHDPRAVAILTSHYGEANLNEARLRMARIPAGADLILNAVSKAPGFTLGNVHVMAGVPAIMQAMLDEVAATIPTGTKMLSRTVPANMGEGRIAAQLGAIQKDFPDVAIGSYPKMLDGGFSTDIVLRSRDADRLDEAARAVEAMIASIWAAQG
ncbi:molybdopterin-binding protein [Kaistia dalseonensis]|uniref:Molybdenum cofactor synthesis domain-containing protein n=1 Tax=Kaistia dalseonensis TaxID=410840 RepID=A0ABU0HBB1_9HYPH|nr:molybdopterin-binding protein [Kaistia dalseonensis]MCX5496972.1 molybdopterin-binding protein [Kaistia dalseonensis]MDQ0439598.1 molybdenum cofactor synthesis domain-containing protein [Kaistia dalseonensis]